MSEKEQRQRVVKALRNLDALSVENRVGIGTPDINYTYGWLELKCLKNWPKNTNIAVKLDHDLTKEQRIWLKRRWAAGGECYVLLQVKREFFLFAGPVAAELIGVANQSRLRGAAVWSCNSAELCWLEAVLQDRADERYR